MTVDNDRGFVNDLPQPQLSVSLTSLKLSRSRIAES